MRGVFKTVKSLESKENNRGWRQSLIVDDELVGDVECELGVSGLKLPHLSEPRGLGPKSVRLAPTGK